jgi:hypothetical protein
MFAQRALVILLFIAIAWALWKFAGRPLVDHLTREEDLSNTEARIAELEAELELKKKAVKETGREIEVSEELVQLNHSLKQHTEKRDKIKKKLNKGKKDAED